MKIMLVNYAYWPPYFGGAIKRLIKHMQSFQSAGHNVVVLTSGVPGYLRSETIDGVLVLRSPFCFSSRLGRLLRRFIFPFWVSKQLQITKPNVVHLENLGNINALFNLLSTWWVTRITHKIGAKTIRQHTIADSEVDMFKVEGLSYKLRLRELKLIDSVVSVSPALHHSLEPYLGDKAACIMNGVDIETFLPLSRSDRDNIRQQNEIQPHRVVFAFLGTLGYRKGFDLLAQAFAELSPDHPDWRLWVIGPHNKDENHNFIEKEAVPSIAILEVCTHQVRYFGRIDDQKVLAGLLAASDVFVFPTRKEGFPNAPLEAMACGLPLIISKIPGVTDQANIENITGHFIEVGDFVSLKKHMLSLGVNAELREAMGQAARRRVEETFGWQNYVDNWQLLYNRLTESS